jgi:hypothetical protein
LIGVVAAAVVCGLLLLLLMLGAGDAEMPKHEGRTLAQWTRDLTRHNPQAQERAEVAIRAMGLQTIPFLAREAVVADPLYRSGFEKWATRFSLRTRRWFMGTFRPFEAAERRHAASRALLLFGTNVPPSVWGEILCDGDRQAAQLAVDGLRRHGTNAVPMLRAALSDEDGYVRSLGCAGLAGLGRAAAAAVPDLIARLIDPESNIPGQASYALTRVGAPAVEPLIEVARRPDDPRRVQAIETLQRMGVEARAARSVLEELTVDPDPAVARAAARALEGLQRQPRKPGAVPGN